MRLTFHAASRETQLARFDNYVRGALMLLSRRVVCRDCLVQAFEFRCDRLDAQLRHFDAARN